jgi:hypothetical protein
VATVVVVILFANDPTLHREAMALALLERTGSKAVGLPDGAPLGEAVARLGPSAVVISGPDEDARRLSRSVPVIRLDDEADRAATYVSGRLVSRRALSGFDDLALQLGALDAPTGSRGAGYVAGTTGSTSVTRSGRDR